MTPEIALALLLASYVVGAVVTVLRWAGITVRVFA